jgi:hypothetical protein
MRQQAERTCSDVFLFTQPKLNPTYPIMLKDDEFSLLSFAHGRGAVVSIVEQLIVKDDI